MMTKSKRFYESMDVVLDSKRTCEKNSKFLIFNKYNTVPRKRCNEFECVIVPEWVFS